MDEIKPEYKAQLEEVYSMSYENEEEKTNKVQETKMNIVRSIMRSDMNETEKNKQMQMVMTFEYMQDTERRRRDSISHYVSNVDVENGSIDASQVTWNDEERGIMGCPHYRRGAKMMCPECHQFFTCRFCHNDACTHSLDRYKVEYMACMYCLRIQKVARSCKYCGKVLGVYYCDVCHFWCDNAAIAQFISFHFPRGALNAHHCPFCNICRHGKGLGIDSYHCPKCNTCIGTSKYDQHVCMENKLDRNCPICGEYLQTSRRRVVFLCCGHAIHCDCCDEYLRNGGYTCPICQKTIADVDEYFSILDQWVKENPMPEEYRDLTQSIYCNDCEVTSVVPYNFLYHKCPKCKSYNTTVVRDTH